MPSLPRPLPGITGPGRRARWRRSVLRRSVAAVCAAAAAVVAVGLLRPAPPPTTDVLVTARAVPAGAVLTAADVVLRPVPRAARQPGALTRRWEAVGRRSGSPLAAGEALTATRLVPRSAADGLPAGTVALHVLLADPAAADLLVPGSAVVVYPAVGGSVLVRDATVLAVDPPPEADGAFAGPPGARGVVLALPAGAGERILAGHGGLDGPPVVNVAASGA